MKKFLPLFVLLAGFLAAAALIVSGPKIEPQPSRNIAPLVRIVEANPGKHRFVVTTQGTVSPRTESDLVPEVDGRVITMSPALVSGGFFTKGDVLLEIDPLDYEVALEQARANLARAESDLNNENKNHVRQMDLIDRGAISDAEIDNSENRVAIAEAVLREATARLARAERDLSRTRVIAPYNGRVRSERVDLGQFVRRGEAIGTLYAVDYAEVRLPIPNIDLGFLDLPLNVAGNELTNIVPVKLRTEFAGVQQSWDGRIVRTEGELDPATRMVQVVASVANPYDQASNRAPLAVGLFVEAEILGREVDNVSVLPRSALREDNRVLLVDNNDQLVFREVRVLRRADDKVYIGSGLSRGDRICISPLQSSTEGMQVRVEGQSQ
ncbi:MAG: efflux RND transporter periplasmic adaptor subunit [Halieaceae bacterium]|jgi:RND family efflux transporter MFP subunit